MSSSRGTSENKNWAARAIEELKKGNTVQIRPRGYSMRGLIESGDLVTLQPLKTAPVVGNIVLVKVRGRVFLHLIKAKLGVDLYQIGNNIGGINGVTPRKFIYGIATKIEK